MLTFFLAYVLPALAVLVLLGVALAPACACSGLWAAGTSRHHQAETERLSRLLREP